jgi:multidrug efflux pump subunit AcrB
MRCAARPRLPGIEREGNDMIHGKCIPGFARRRPRQTAVLLGALAGLALLAAWPAAQGAETLTEQEAVRRALTRPALLDALQGGTAAALVGLALAGRSFLPDFNEGSLTISAVTLPGTSLGESDRLARRVETILLNEPEVTATARRTGRAELDPHAQGIHSSEIDVSLTMKDRGKEELLAALRE